MNKKQILITPDVIEDCLCESLDILEKKNHSYSKSRKAESLE